MLDRNGNHGNDRLNVLKLKSMKLMTDIYILHSLLVYGLWRDAVGEVHRGDGL